MEPNRPVRDFAKVPDLTHVTPDTAQRSLRDTGFPALATCHPSLWPTAPASVDGTSRLRRPANTPQAGEIFHKISGRNAVGGFAPPGGDLHGPTRHIAGKDGAQFGDQRLPGSVRKTPGSGHIQSFDLSSLERLIDVRREDQRGDPRAEGPVPLTAQPGGV